MTPAEVAGAFVEAIAAGDLDAALTLYDEEAVLGRPDGSLARGREEIAEVLGMLSGRRLALRSERVVQTGAVALADERWSIGEEGPEVRSQVVCHRGPDGR